MSGDYTHRAPQSTTTVQMVVLRSDVTRLQAKVRELTAAIRDLEAENARLRTEGGAQ